MEEKLDIITIGEGLIELSSNQELSLAPSFNKFYGGDALTTAIAAQKMGSKVGFISRVGCDYFKEFLMDSWQAEGIDISQVKLTEDSNGLYLLARLKNGKKEFSYYRKKTAAAKLSIEDLSEKYFENANYFYTSGTVQSLSLSTRETVKKAFKLAKEKTLTTAYDPNFSSLLVSQNEAKEFFEEINENIDILFLNDKNDMINIFDIDSIEKTIKACWDLGINIIIVRSSKNNGYYTGYAGDIVFQPFIEREVVDLTGSGDAFNGGYLHALSSGFTPFSATKFAAIVAAVQIKELGAIKSLPNKKEVYEEYEKIK